MLIRRRTMQFSTSLYGRLVAGSLVLALLAPCAEAVPVQGSAADPQTSEAAPQSVSSANSEPSLPDNPSPATPAVAQDASQAPAAPAPQQQQPVNPQQGSKPVGTAAAPYEKTLGVAASRPAGAVIAPAKQRRVRTIWISVAVVVGAGIAVGSVVGLSKASSSRP